MDKDNTFRPRKVVPQEHEVQMEDVHEMQKSAGMEIPTVDGEVNIKGNIPPEMRKYMSPEPSKHGPTARPQKTYHYQDSNNGDAIKDLLAGIKGITETYDEVTLPSLGKFYNGEDGPTDGVVHIRPMTGNEEKILATPRFVKKGQAVNMIFKNCLSERINPDDLLTIDRTYLLIYLRGISYTPDYEVEIKCTECGNKFQNLINLDTLFVDYCPDDFNESSLTSVLPASGFTFKYRLSRGKDESMIQEHRERRLKNFGDAGHDDTLLYRASLLVEQIDTPNGHVLTGQGGIQTVLERLPIKDVAHIRNLLTDPPFGVDTKIELDCPGCNNGFSADLPLEANFFFPRTRRTTREVHP